MPKIVDKKAKADRIAEAAIRALRKNGYAKTRMADIAEAAGIGKGTLYEYFADKPAIVRHCFTAYFETFARGMNDAMESAPCPADKLFALLSFALAHALEWEDHCAVVIDQMSCERAEEERAFLTGVYDGMKALIADILSQGQEDGSLDPGFSPETMAALFVSLYDGVILQRLLQEKPLDAAGLSSALSRLLRQGILAEKQDAKQKKGGAPC
ncbi:MAG: TetR/AcrR family transcriptional regulator [Thermodesulfobacteriota bacterium]